MSMLQNSVIVFHQILVMFLLMLVGYLLFCRNILDNHTTSRIPPCSIRLSCPAVCSRPLTVALTLYWHAHLL